MWRIRNHQTQEGLAEKSGLSSRSVAGLERGEVRRPRRKTVESLADALGLTDDARAEFRQGAEVQYPDGHDASALQFPVPGHGRQLGSAGKS